MFSKVSSHDNRISRVRRVRARIFGSVERPRLAVFRSLVHLSAQLIDDTAGQTLVAVTDKGMVGKPIEKAKQVGQKLAEVAKAKNITTVVFDRAGYQYHGRVAALAEGARDGGLKF